MATPDAPTPFESVALPHLGDCYAFAMSLAGNASDAEDLVQETYLKAQRAFDSFELGTNVKAWLFTILRRAHIDRHRRTKIRPAALPTEELEPLALAPGPPEADLPHGLTALDVRRALEEVPEPFRVALRLRDIDGLAYAEIGRILDVPAGTVMSRIHRGRESLRRILVRSGGSGGPGPDPDGATRGPGGSPGPRPPAPPKDP